MLLVILFFSTQSIGRRLIALLALRNEGSFEAVPAIVSCTPFAIPFAQYL
jgi:hypothetical protein